MNKISAVYKIVNTVTGDCYVGSSWNVMMRWTTHKCPSTWGQHPNSQLYRDFQKYGLDKFRFQILAPVMPEHLKQVEQEFIDMVQPTYNNYNANGWDVERTKETNRKAQRKYNRSEKRKESKRKYYNRLCCYNGEEMTLNALRQRFQRSGVEHPDIEAKKYLLEV